LAPDLLVALSQEAYERYVIDLQKEGVAVYDAGLVKPRGGLPQPHIPVDATRTAVEGLSQKQVANMVMLAAVAALTGIVSQKALLGAALDAVPARLREINQRALEAGFRLGESAREGLSYPLPDWTLCEASARADA
jgi:2-oxoglutarate ferredoxin oxidoreductase subunit gamma